MARKEDKLIMPKHLAEEEYFLLPLQIYHDHPDGLAFSDKGKVIGFKSLLAEALAKIGKEKERKTDETHYTKCAQIPRYFGFVRYVVASDHEGTSTITARGGSRRVSVRHAAFFSLSVRFFRHNASEKRIGCKRNKAKE